MNSKFKILALGGLDENGKNCYILESKDDILVIEVGSANFSNKSLGIDVVLPDFQYLFDNKDKVRGILISHGHMDQMAGLSYLIEKLKVPVYGSQYTLEFLKFYINKNDYNLLTEIKYNSKEKIGNFNIEVFGLSHSIFGNLGFVVSIEEEAIVYATDFNFDQSAIKFARTDVKKIIQLSNKYKIKALLIESISAEESGIASSNQLFKQSFNRYIEETQDRIIITLYSSNLDGVNNVIKMAEEHDKKVVIIGRDLLNYVNISKSLNYISHKKDLFVRVNDIQKYDDNELIVVVAGFYATPFVEISKMSTNTHNIIKLKETDNVLIGSKAYDEIESFGQEVMDLVARTGAKITHLNVSVPSHAHQEDIKMMINLFEPQMIIPVKGEYRKLKKVQSLATEVGYESGDVHLLKNGEVLEIFDEYGTITNDIRLNSPLVSKEGIINPIILKDREILSDNGYVLIILSFIKGESKITQEPEIISGGLNEFTNDNAIMEGCKKIVYNELEKDMNSRDLVNKLKSKISRYLQNNIGKTPMILPVRMEIDPKRIKGKS